MAAGRAYSKRFSGGYNEILIINEAAAKAVGYTDPEIIGKHQQWEEEAR